MDELAGKIANQVAEIVLKELGKAQLRLLDVHEAADVLGVSTATVGRLVRAGKLRATKLGARTMFTQDALRAL